MRWRRAYANPAAVTVPAPIINSPIIPCPINLLVCNARELKRVRCPSDELLMFSAERDTDDTEKEKSERQLDSGGDEDERKSQHPHHHGCGQGAEADERPLPDRPANARDTATHDAGCDHQSAFERDDREQGRE